MGLFLVKTMDNSTLSLSSSIRGNFILCSDVLGSCSLDLETYGRRTFVPKSSSSVGESSDSSLRQRIDLRAWKLLPKSNVL
ncbi:hypothetical protein M9H77_29817 [Catharanthus roseus]|uniref:Uncharacterized protein n=1 Tax=Catharanthus roseus TaxID=4058 RepID=A0ACB9ZVJ1_CATRO|nr:hypothetical protein M9H77_29817 [Catharanthus roseus]